MFWDICLNEKQNLTGHGYVTGDKKLRSVNIDTEPKVIRKLQSNDSKRVLRDGNLVIGRKGRGCNWALGYHGSKQGSEGDSLDVAMNVLRKEIERCEQFTGLIMMHSLSGGTGSGLGSHLCQLIRDEYPLHHMLNCAVTPHNHGESPLQHYNSLLCLAWLQRHSDGVVLFHNDEVLSLQESRRRKKCDVHHINRHIAECLCNLFLPADDVTPSSGVSIGLEPWQMLQSVCPMPSLKLLHVTQASASKTTLKNLASQLTHTVRRRGCSNHTRPWLICVLLRGNGEVRFPSNLQLVERHLMSAYNCVKWNPHPIDFWFGAPCVESQTSSLTVAANYTSVVDYLDHEIHSAQRMFDARAYLHWYKNYGCEESDFTEAFDTIRTVVSDYKEAVS
ncbi:Tubulin delta chain [Lamellibrachia satsuma]|nr:Tubulin delta chain [Lamellibrachia satsuma]